MSSGLKEHSRNTNIVLGLAGVFILLATTATSIALYRGALDTTVRVTVLSDRAGLMLEPGSDVKMRDVVVGRVEDVHVDSGQAAIEIDLQADHARSISENAVATIDPTTLFGRKFVALANPGGPPFLAIEEGTVLEGQSVPTEVNDLLSSLVDVLRAVEPQKVNGALNALATSLHGRGDELGETLVQLDGYLGRFNGSLPTLQRDLAAGADTADLLAAATPDLVETVANLTTTGNTISEKQSQLSAFLLSFTKFGNRGESFAHAAAVPLVESMRTLTPTTALLAERAPTYPCFMESLAQTNKYLERTVGGSAMPGLNILGTLLMGDPPYTSPADLPVVSADGPTRCYDWTSPQPHTDFNDGSHAYSGAKTLVDLIGNPFAQFVSGGGR
ncbi:MCE family protein [Rhodococcus sp. APC 3903]|uniref:MCE family protein n=1 Tax=Rhodococcus sp. APC 3903 TaxID=3035193 RepID=UPI0025B611A9|nr:MCE family protein [Rhodococcus sp. APC 3903]MDN3459900.1 MCE family protein [Rhodococcus sp. APC 3903]